MRVSLHPWMSAVTLLGCSTFAFGAATLQWVQGTFPENAQTTGNSTINGKLPPGNWQVWNFQITLQLGAVENLAAAVAFGPDPFRNARLTGLCDIALVKNSFNPAHR